MKSVVISLLLAAMSNVAADDLSLSETPAQTILADERAQDADWVFTIALEAFEAQGQSGFDDAGAIDGIRSLLFRGDELGHGPSRNLLGVMFQNGLGVSADPGMARLYFERAYAAGDPVGGLNLGTMQLFSGSAESEHRAHGTLSAVIDMTDPASPEHKAASGWVGYMLAFGLGNIERDPARAAALLELGLETSPEAPNLLFAMGDLHAGEPLADPAASLAYFERAAEAGHGPAAWRAGMAYLQGDGVEIDEARAFQLVEISANAGDEQGMLSLAVMHAIGQGTEQRGDIARYYYEQVASRGNVHAMRSLGMMMLTGEGAAPEPVLGTALLQIAAGAGDHIAVQLLADLQGHLPDDPEWSAAVAEQRAAYLAHFELDEAALYGAQTSP